MKRTILFLLIAGCGGSPRGGSSSDLDAALDACARGDLAAAESMVKDARDPGSVRLRARILMMRNRNREAIELLAPLLQEKVKSYEGVEQQSQDIAKFMQWRLREFPRMFPDGKYPPNTLLVIDRLVQEQFLVEVQTVAAL
mgnify:CR=1 FL=1